MTGPWNGADTGRPRRRRRHRGISEPADTQAARFDRRPTEPAEARTEPAEARNQPARSDAEAAAEPAEARTEPARSDAEAAAEPAEARTEPARSDAEAAAEPVRSTAERPPADVEAPVVTPGGAMTAARRGGAVRGRRDNIERQWRELAGGGHSQLSRGVTIRVRDALRPSAEDIAEAEATVEIRRRNWTPPPASG